MAKATAPVKNENEQKPDVKNETTAPVKNENNGVDNADENKLLEEESILGPEAGKLPAEKQPEAKNLPPNEKHNLIEYLSQFDYKNLKGDQFKKYVALVGDRSCKQIVDGKEMAIVGELKENDEYDFVLYKTKPIIQDRYVGVEGSPKDFVGLTIVDDTPQHTTRIPVKVALMHNAQIMNAHSRAGHGKYYLLKK
ncbi:MAG: hypothetical protein IPJ81_18080 [Chitinophagaceae bacterium]|nr:hypothetical protein [Chitinophagaceae bacterium]